MRLGVKFNLPFRFVDEGKYDLNYKKFPVKIMIKLVQNYEAAEKIMGMKIETSGEGAKVDMNADEHGVVNFTQLRVEISDKSDFNLDNLLDSAGMNTETLIKISVMQIVNRLAEVVKHATNNYWIRLINLRDIMDFQVFDLSVKPPRAMVSFNPSHGYSFPNFKVVEQSEVEVQINQLLMEETSLPTWKTLLLDSINHFTTEKFNEAVIISNVALESFIAEYLYEKLNDIFPNKQVENRERILKLPKSLHRIMKKHFPEIDGRNLQTDHNLWNKFDRIRTEIRPQAVHSFTKTVDQITSLETIQDIREIIKWVNPKKAI